ncbi:MAG: IS200/IS605 family transposase [Chitinophagaceae bacterium]|nr:IS200/IS605 family transposase [Chitinophagaceae bacterium]
MAYTFVRNAVQLVFSTKHRRPIILDFIKNELHNYLGGICNQLDCQAIQVGGYSDHVHVLCLLSKKIALMKLAQELKSRSSGWMKTNGDVFQDFYWQEGYGAFSVHHSNLDNVSLYISNQHIHHQSVSFQDEFRAFLIEHNITADERYLWQ